MDRHVILLLDEMYIQEDLSYNKHTRALIGFANLGEIKDHLKQFEQSLQGADSTLVCQLLAKSMLVIMARGLFTKLRLPFAHFTCMNLTAR